MNITESNTYNTTYRGVYKEGLGVKTYNSSDYDIIRDRITFDKNKKDFSSLDRFVESILSEILLSINIEAKRKNEIIMDLEGVVDVDIINPLRILNVVGYEDLSYISKINVKIYMYSFLELSEIKKFVERALESSILYQTFKKLDIFNIKFVFLD